MPNKTLADIKKEDEKGQKMSKERLLVINNSRNPHERRLKNCFSRTRFKPNSVVDYYHNSMDDARDIY